MIDKYLGAVDPDNFDVVQDFSGPFPVEVITRMAGVPEEYRQQVRHWIDTSLHHEPGQIEVSEAGVQANIDTAMYYFSLVQERRQEPQDDMISRLIAAEIPGEGGQLRKLDDIEICGFATLLGGAGAETVTKLMGNAAVIFANHPDQWQKLQEDRDKIPGRSKNSCATRGRCNTTSATPSKRPTSAAASFRRANPCSCAEPRPTATRMPSPTPTRSTSSAITPRRSTSDSGTASTVAWAPRWPAWRAGSRWSGCSTSCRATRSTWPGANG
ncbi:putative cytochrome p450 [Mycobacterium intracellulare]|nr:putative cytochrome p450 [Mycobacterium intracellulare]